MHRTVPRIAVVFRIIRQLKLKRCSHTQVLSALEARDVLWDFAEPRNFASGSLADQAASVKLLIRPKSKLGICMAQTVIGPPRHTPSLESAAVLRWRAPTSHHTIRLCKIGDQERTLIVEKPVPAIHRGCERHLRPAAIRIISSRCDVN